LTIPQLHFLRGYLDHRIFVGDSKEIIKTKEREATMLFGTQENTSPFPMKYSPFMFSQE
jgi:hypothetical protein